MKNKIDDLRDHLFEMLEQLKDGSDKNGDPLKPEATGQLIERAHAMAGISGRILESAKLEIEAVKLGARLREADPGREGRISGFLSQDIEGQ